MAESVDKTKMLTCNVNPWEQSEIFMVFGEDFFGWTGSPKGWHGLPHAMAIAGLPEEHKDLRWPPQNSHKV